MKAKSIPQQKPECGKCGTNNELDFTNHVSGGDLDIPGSELDDSLESIGVKMKKIMATA